MQKRLGQTETFFDQRQARGEGPSAGLKFGHLEGTLFDTPLRSREDDPLILAEHFLQEYSTEERKEFDGFSREAAAAIVSYDWPGNVRELQNVVRNMVVMNPGGEVAAAMLPPQIASLAPGGVGPEGAAAPMATSGLGSDLSDTMSPANAPDDIRPLEDTERDAIERAIELCDGNVRMAATYLEVSPATLYRKRAKWDESEPAADTD